MKAIKFLAGLAMVLIVAALILFELKENFLGWVFCGISFSVSLVGMILLTQRWGKKRN